MLSKIFKFFQVDYFLFLFINIVLCDGIPLLHDFTRGKSLN